MALSYLSKTVQNTPYIAGFDLNLMAKVLGQEQGKFDAEGQKIQSQIDQMGSLEVMRGVDRDYLNNKVNNIVKNINDLGGVNIGDENVASQIEGMGSEIYGDDNVVNAVAATKQIRNLQSGYEKMKSDPKMMKYYSKANEDWDLNNGVNPNSAVHYLSSNKLGDSYSGASSASPYHNYQDELNKAVSQVKATLTEVQRPDGSYSYLDTKNEEVKPERILQTASYALSADAQDQMRKDGAFAFKGVAPQEMVRQALDLNAQKYGDAYNSYMGYMTKASMASNASEAQQYQALATVEKGRADALLAAHKKLSTTGEEEFMKDPSTFNYQVYKDQYFRGLADKFAYNKTSVTHSTNYGAIAEAKFNQAAQFHEEDLKEKYYAAGYHYLGKDKDGKPITAALAPLTTGTENTNVGDAKRNENWFVERNKVLSTQQEDLFRQTLRKAFAGTPLSSIAESNVSETGLSTKIAGQDLLEQVNGVPGLQVDDFKDFNPDSPAVKTFLAANKVTLTDQQRELVSHIYENFNLAANGQQGAVSIDPEIQKSLKAYQFLEAEKQANASKVVGVQNELYSLAGFTPAEKKLFEEYRQNPKQFTQEIGNDQGTITSGGVGGFGGGGGGVVFGKPYISVTNDKITALQQRLNKVNTENVKNDYYTKASNVANYDERIIGEDNPYVKNGQLQRILASSVSSVGGSYNKEVVGALKQELSRGYDFKDVQIESVRKAVTGGYEIVGNVPTGKKHEDGSKVLARVTAPINSQTAEALGVTFNQYQALNDVTRLRGETEPLALFNSRGTAARIKIVKQDPGNLNDNSCFVQILVDGRHPINVMSTPPAKDAKPVAKKVFDDAATAYAAMETVLEGSGGSLEDFIRNSIYDGTFKLK